MPSFHVGEQRCRACGHNELTPFLDLGAAPPSNAYRTLEDLHKPELWFPLRLQVCTSCWLAQTEDFVGREQMFSPDYAYFSSYSNSWLAHARRYVDEVVSRFELNPSDWVVEIAANDGYLLQYVQQKNIPCLGVEPTHCTAVVARQKGIPIIERFFGVELASELVAQQGRASLVVGNNVLAHVPDLNDFVAGVALLLRDDGIATFEFPHLLQLLSGKQFDTVYHEHFSYLSVTALQPLLARHGLVLFDIDELSTHGGSLRLYWQKQSGMHSISSRVTQMLQKEQQFGLLTLSRYQQLQRDAEQIRDELLLFLIDAKKQRLRLGAYGAAAKGNTLFNYCGIRRDRIAWVVDANPNKQGRYLPGSGIPIVDESVLRAQKPDRILVLPWNLADELRTQLAYIEQWGGQLVAAIPHIRVLR